MRDMNTDPQGGDLDRRIAGYRNLVDAILSAPLERPFVTMWHPDRDPEFETLTFERFLGEASGFSAFYESHGVRQGDTVVLIMPQGVQLMAAFVGAMLRGAIPTILAYPTFKVDPEKYRFGLSGVTHNIQAALLVLDRGFPTGLLELLRGSEGARIVQVAEGEPQAIPWAGASSSQDPDRIAFIQHSAGTTGLQKGVALPHRSVLNQLRHLVAVLDLSSNDRIVSWLPLYHDMGLIACFVLPLACHLHVVMESPTDWVLRPGSLLRLATEFNGTLCWLPNFAFQFMARRVSDDEKRALDLSSLRAMINCSEPVSAASMGEFYDVFRSVGFAESALHSSYAMAENTFAVTQSDVRDRGTRSIRVERDSYFGKGIIRLEQGASPSALSLTSSGRCLPDNEVQVRGKDGSDLGEGRHGELFVRSDSLFGGYYGRPDLTSMALVEGWYRTGDVGFVLDGELYVTGRRDDMIIVGGKNLYPQDIEAIVCTHEMIHDGRAVAFGLYNASLGTQDLFVVAEVSSPESLERRETIETEVRRSVTSEIGVPPRVVRIVPPMWLVKSTAGKPARSSTRDKFLREYPEFNASIEEDDG